MWTALKVMGTGIIFLGMAGVYAYTGVRLMDIQLFGSPEYTKGGNK